MNQYTFYRKKIAGRIVVNDGFVGFEAANVIESTISNENPNYNWEEKIILSLSVDEIGKMILLLSGRNSEVSLFHTSASGNKTLKGKRMDNGNILISMDHTLPTGDKRVVSGISLTPESIVVIEELLKSGIFSLTYQKPRG